MTLPIHPFPARMAPDIAIATLSGLGRDKRIVLDPMAGSGTVIRHAVELGHSAFGFDLDPLATLMSRVWTTPVPDHAIEAMGKRVVKQARRVSTAAARLPWLDKDKESLAFVRYWFAPRQRRELRKLAYVIARLGAGDVSAAGHALQNVMKAALSRTIITKEQGASLGRDISHSRPHKVSDTSDYDVFLGFERALSLIRKRLDQGSLKGRARVKHGDARSLKSVPDSSVDMVLTSPPYLNAIDYMRGHRLSLVWMGYRVADLRRVRSESIGTERALGRALSSIELTSIRSAMGDLGDLPSRYQGMVDRYVVDMDRVMAETARVLKRGGQATFVIGNSCLRGVFVRNSAVLLRAAHRHALMLVRKRERALPHAARYLPTPKNGTLAKRMRKEIVLTFSKKQ